MEKEKVGLKKKKKKEKKPSCLFLHVVSALRHQTDMFH